MTGCAFCQIVAGTSAATVIREWPDAVAFVPRNPVVDGHVLVVPREHVADATTSLEITASTMARAAELAREFPAANIRPASASPRPRASFTCTFTSSGARRAISSWCRGGQPAIRTRRTGAGWPKR